VSKQDDLFLGHVDDEVGRARDKFPSPNLCFAALVEEVGELSEAMLKNAAGSEGWGPAQVYHEAVQVAAMALRCAVDGDPSFSSIPYSDPGSKPPMRYDDPDARWDHFDKTSAIDSGPRLG
jgi:hypothetical protein